MKRAISLLLILAFCLSLCACGKVDTEAVDRQLQGFWVSSQDGITTDSTGSAFLFRNGRFASQAAFEGVKLDPKEGDYEITNKVIKLNYDNGVEGKLEYTFKNGELEIDSFDLIKIDE